MDIDVTSAGDPAFPHLGHLQFGSLRFPCALGRSGIVRAKREGDGGTPEGQFALLELRYRPDRLAPPSPLMLPVKPIAPRDGWCDAPEDPLYNQPVTLPYPASAEHMWREDHLYDLVTVLDYNLAPVRAFAGSAIFFHVAKQDESGQLQATEGCVALRLEHMCELLPLLGPTTKMRVF